MKMKDYKSDFPWTWESCKSNIGRTKTRFQSVLDRWIQVWFTWTRISSNPNGKLHYEYEIKLLERKSVLRVTATPNINLLHFQNPQGSWLIRVPLCVFCSARSQNIIHAQCALIYPRKLMKAPRRKPSLVPLAQPFSGLTASWVKTKTKRIR